MDNISKCELHLHLGGAYPKEYLISVCNEDELLDLENHLAAIKSGVCYHECFKAFDSVSKIVCSLERVELGTFSLCKDCINENIVYIEIRSGLKDLGGGYEAYLKAILQGIEKAQEYAQQQCKIFTARILLSLRRQTTPNTVAETFTLLRKYRNSLVAGLDISGDSTIGDAQEIFDVCHVLEEERIPVTLHIGESPLETPEQQMRELRFLKPRRLGHCVHLCPEARSWVLEHRIPVEMCLSSAVLVGMITRADDHPALQWLRAGHPVVICTDDPLIFGTSLTKECEMAASILNYSVEKIEQLQIEAMKVAF